jgi:hypothetical protein
MFSRSVALFLTIMIVMLGAVGVALLSLKMLEYPKNLAVSLPINFLLGWNFLGIHRALTRKEADANS